MNRPKTLLVILFLLAAMPLVAPAHAQRAGDLFGGDLPQEYTNGINSKFDHLDLDAAFDGPRALETLYPPERIEAFFANVVARVSLYPDGSYVAYALPGGEIVSLKLGRKKTAIGGETWESDRWLLNAGEFATPKRPSGLSLTLSAAGNEVTVDCVNNYSRSDQTVTYYVGPMNGLLCVGLVDEEALPFDEIVRTADSKTARRASSPGS